MNLSHAVPGWRTLLAGLAVALLLLPACKKSGRRPVVKVRGEVLVKDARPGTPAMPAEDAQLVFYLQNDPDPEHPLPLNPSAKADKDGAFQVQTYGLNDGLPEGEYVVTITWREPQKRMGGIKEVDPNFLPEKYADPKTSPLRGIEIRKGMDPLHFEVEFNPKWTSTLNRAAKDRGWPRWASK
jgi:hypothetical protein